MRNRCGIHAFFAAYGFGRHKETLLRTYGCIHAVFLKEFVRLLLCGLQQKYRNLIVDKLQIIVVFRQNPDRNIRFKPFT